jgi:Dolichyl-phosphate-mannose-protein mannosyltransferase
MRSVLAAPRKSGLVMISAKNKGLFRAVHNPASHGDAARHGKWEFVSRHGDVLAVLGLALLLRLVFAALMTDIYDADEFVYLGLGRDLAHGAVPYRDFPFFHPPGILVLLHLLDPLTAVWWPSARLADILADSVTAALVWRVGMRLYGRREAMAAGTLYATNPIALITSTRVMEEPFVTTLGMIGLTILLTWRSHRAASVAGACVGAAFWIRYPAIVFLPVYALAAPRRILAFLAGWFAATILLFAPYFAEAHALFEQTVVWQLLRRVPSDPSWRLHKVAVFWLIANPLALVALLRTRRPVWLIVGFLTGGVYLFTAYAYYHYFLPVAPFAALLGAPIAARWVRIPRRTVAVAGIAFAAMWAGDVRSHGPYSGFFTTASFSHVRPIIHFIERVSPARSPILEDRFEYAYLSGRPWVAHYFWNMHDWVTARTLERHLRATRVVVLTSYLHGYPYPNGFVSYMDAHYVPTEIRGVTIWLTGHQRLAHREQPPRRVL